MWSMSRCPKPSIWSTTALFSKPSSRQVMCRLQNFCDSPYEVRWLKKTRCLWVKVSYGGLGYVGIYGIHWMDTQPHRSERFWLLVSKCFKHRDELQWLKEYKSASLNLLLTSNVVGASTVIQGTVKGWHSQQFLAYDWLMLFGALGWPWSGCWAALDLLL